MKTKFFVCLSIVVSLAPGAIWSAARDDGPPVPDHKLSEFRVWTNADGKQMTATLISLEGNIGKFKV